jgi:hypothetical protein
MKIVWTEYLKYRAALRGFDLAKVEQIIQSSKERYMDTATNRQVVIGRCGKTLILIPYEVSEEVLTPVTIHATTRQQIELRLKIGRFIHG